MVESDADSHADQKQDGEPENRSEVTGEECGGDGREPQKEEDARRRSHVALVEDGDVDALDFFAKIVRFCACRGHDRIIPQGVSGGQWRRGRPIR